jgi:hypothetical protein
VVKKEYSLKTSFDEQNNLQQQMGKPLRGNNLHFFYEGLCCFVPFFTSPQVFQIRTKSKKAGKIRCPVFHIQEKEMEAG